MKKLKFALVIGCLMCSLGLGFQIIPYPNSRVLINIYGRLGILEDVIFANTEIYPMYSSHQAINVDIYAFNGSFTFLVMDDDELYKYFVGQPYSALFISSNLTYINKRIDVSALNEWPYLRCSAVIIPNEFIVITGSITAEYLEHYYIVAFISLVLGSLSLIYYFCKRNTLQKRELMEHVKYYDDF